MDVDTAAQVANVDEEADDTVRGALAPTGSDKRADFLPGEKLGSSPDARVTEGMGTGSEDGTPAEDLDAAARNALDEDESGEEGAEALRGAGVATSLKGGG